ncbi:MAG: hypothetical protein KDD38_07100 [Bdellovibrionales bacterium]|nr:hypothetical protein [Bdellovibrionales bacterium]
MNFIKRLLFKISLIPIPPCAVVLLFLTVAASPKASAEYRAFELTITDTDKNKERTVISTLDHLQYPRYYPLMKNEIIAYTDSWMCYENMANFTKTCNKPDRDVATLKPSSTPPTPLKTNSATNP